MCITYLLYNVFPISLAINRLQYHFVYLYYDLMLILVLVINKAKILFVCPYVVVYYTRPVLTSGSFIDFWSCLFVLTLLSIIRGLYWRVVHSLTSDPVCLSLRWCLLYEACVDEWFIHWLLILFVCPYVGVYYTRPVLTSGSFIDFWLQVLQKYRGFSTYRRVKSLMDNS